MQGCQSSIFPIQNGRNMNIGGRGIEGAVSVKRNEIEASHCENLDLVWGSALTARPKFTSFGIWKRGIRYPRGRCVPILGFNHSRDEILGT